MIYFLNYYYINLIIIKNIKNTLLINLFYLIDSFSSSLTSTGDRFSARLHNPDSIKVICHLLSNHLPYKIYKTNHISLLNFAFPLFSAAISPGCSRLRKISGSVIAEISSERVSITLNNLKVDSYLVQKKS
jgi:hypothetical protein